MEEGCRGRGRKHRKRVALCRNGCNACQPNDLCCLRSSYDQADDGMAKAYRGVNVDAAAATRRGEDNASSNEAECGSSCYDDVVCEICRGGDNEDLMLLCDKCDRGFHMYCLSPVAISVPQDDWFCPLCIRPNEVLEFPKVQTKIVDFFRIQKLPQRILTSQSKKRRRHSGGFTTFKKSRKLVLHTPAKDPKRRLKQMASLATALSSTGVTFSDELTYVRGLAPRSSNSASMEKGGMQNWIPREIQFDGGDCSPFLERTISQDPSISVASPSSRKVKATQARAGLNTSNCQKLLLAEDLKNLLGSVQGRKSLVSPLSQVAVMRKDDKATFYHSKAMWQSGQCPPLMVTYDPFEGFVVEADSPIKDLTIIAEYTGDVDFMCNRIHDKGDSIMGLLFTKDPLKELVICPDKRGNLARFVSGINNHTPDGRKKQNVRCVRFDVDGEARALLIAIRDIPLGERLYYDYNGYQQDYPTEHFV